MDEVLKNSKIIFDRSTRPFGIARVRLDNQGNPADVTIEYLNAAMAATADSTPADLLGKNVYEVWADGDRTWLDYFYRAAYLGEAVEFETISAAYRMFQDVAIFPIAEGYCGYQLNDITLFKETEASSARRSEIIEGLSAEYFILYNVDLANDVIEPYIVRNEVAVYFASIIGESMSYEEWLEDYCVNYVACSYRDEVMAHLNRAALLDYAASSSNDRSVIFKRLFGSEEQFVELRVMKTGEDASKVVLAARNINDEMTKKLDQSEALKTALAVAERASEAKTTFLTNISHDLRTPLNSIMGFCDLALGHVGDAAVVEDSLRKIRLSSGHLLNLINDILDVNRIESGKLVLSEQSLDLVRLVEEVREVFVDQAQEKGISFFVDASAVTHCQVLGDPLRLKQIMLNTVGNAIKYTDRGGRVGLTVSEGAVSPNGVGMFEVVVSDNGCGMSDDFLDRIFMPFERDSMGRAPQTEGTGLGMTITKNLVDLLGGTIKVESKLLKGSRFTILLPLRLNRSEPAERRGGIEVGDYRSMRFDGLRMLVVDDDELSREMMGAILEDFGFECQLVCDGDEAVDAVADSPEGHFDAVIMDMRMPRMEGDVATRAIRVLPRRDVAQLPVIALTADAFEEMYRRSREAGMTAHATKPVNTKELILLLDKYLHRRQ